MKQAEPTATAAEVRRRLEISERTWSRWSATGLPIARRDKHGRKPVVRIWDLCRWLHARADSRAARGEESQSEREQAKVRREHARRLTRENEIAEGRLVRAEDLGRELAQIGATFRAEAEAIERVHGEAVGRDVRAMIERARAEWQARLGADRVPEAKGADDGGREPGGAKSAGAP